MTAALAKATGTAMATANGFLSVEKRSQGRFFWFGAAANGLVGRGEQLVRKEGLLIDRAGIRAFLLPWKKYPTYLFLNSFSLLLP